MAIVGLAGSFAPELSGPMLALAPVPTPMQDDLAELRADLAAIDDALAAMWAQRAPLAETVMRLTWAAYTRRAP